MGWKWITLAVLGAFVLLLGVDRGEAPLQPGDANSQSLSQSANPQSKSPNPPKQYKGELFVDFHKGLKQREGVLILTAPVDPAAFPETGIAKLEVQVKRGPTGLVTGGEVPYEITGPTIEAKREFNRHTTNPLIFTLTLRVKDKNGKEYVFEGKRAETIDPLGELMVAFPTGAKHRTGKLTMAAQVDPAAFTDSGSATLEVQVKGGPQNLLKEGNVPYKITGTILEAQQGFYRHPTDTLYFALTLRVKDKNGEEHAFATDNAIVEPLPQWKPTWEWLGGVLVVVVVIIMFIAWWWHGHSRPELITPNNEQLQLDSNTRASDEVIQCTVRRRTKLDVKWNINEGRFTDEPLSVSYALDDSEQFKELRRGESGCVELKPKRLVVFPLKKSAKLTLRFKLHERVKLPFHQKVHYEIFRVRRKSQKLCSRDVELVLSEPVDIGELLNKVDELRTEVSSLSSKVSALTSLPGNVTLITDVSRLSSIGSEFPALTEKVADLERLLGGKEALASLASWHIANGGLSQELSHRMPSFLHREEAALLATVNRWWQDEKLNREELQKLLKKIDLPARFYAIKDIAETLADVIEPVYTFEPSPDEGGWLWFQRQVDDEALAVPADPSIFGGKLGGVRTLVRRMFEGIDEIPDKVHFERAYRACRLRAMPGKAGKYKLVSRGYLLLRGTPDPGLSLPQTYEMMVQRKSGGTFTNQPLAGQIDRLSLMAILEAHLRQLANSFRNSQEAFACLAGDMNQINLRLKDVERRQPHPPASEWEDGSPTIETLNRSIRKLNSVSEEVKQLRERPDAIEQSLTVQPSVSEEVKQLRERLDAIEQSLPEVPPSVSESEKQLREWLDAIEKQSFPVERHQAEADTTDGESGGAAASGVSLQPKATESKPSTGEGAGIPQQGEVGGEGETASMKETGDGSQQSTLQAQGLSPAKGGEKEQRQEGTTNYKSEEEKSEGEKAGEAVSAPSEPIAKSGTGANYDQLPAGWAEAVEEAYKKSGDQADREKVDPNHYVNRLLNLKETLRKLVYNSQAQFSVEVVHLERAGKNFRVHRGECKEEGGRRRFVYTGGRQPLEGNYLFQLFLLLESNQGDVAWVLLPLGSFSENGYPYGYEMLLEKVPVGFVQITSVRRPARLDKVEKHGDLYAVTEKMQFKHEASDGKSI